MTGKKNQFDPSEMYKQWLQNVGQAQNFMNNMNTQQAFTGSLPTAQSKKPPDNVPNDQSNENQNKIE